MGIIRKAIEFCAEASLLTKVTACTLAVAVTAGIVAVNDRPPPEPGTMRVEGFTRYDPPGAWDFVRNTNWTGLTSNFQHYAVFFGGRPQSTFSNQVINQNYHGRLTVVMSRVPIADLFDFTYRPNRGTNDYGYIRADFSKAVRNGDISFTRPENANAMIFSRSWPGILPDDYVLRGGPYRFVLDTLPAVSVSPQFFDFDFYYQCCSGFNIQGVRNIPNVPYPYILTCRGHGGSGGSAPGTGGGGGSGGTGGNNPGDCNCNGNPILNTSAYGRWGCDTDPNVPCQCSITVGISPCDDDPQVSRCFCTPNVSCVCGLNNCFCTSGGAGTNPPSCGGNNSSSTPPPPPLPPHNPTRPELPEVEGWIPRPPFDNRPPDSSPGTNSGDEGDTGESGNTWTLPGWGGEDFDGEAGGFRPIPPPNTPQGEMELNPWGDGSWGIHDLTPDLEQGLIDVRQMSSTCACNILVFRLQYDPLKRFEEVNIYVS